MLIKVILVAASLAVVFGQRPSPKPCNTPPQWQGKFVRRDDSKQFAEKAEISYDLSNKRIREVRFEEEGKNQSFVDVLYLHNVNKEYRIDPKTGNCTVGPLTRDFPVYGIPPNAKYQGTAVIGPVNIPDEHAVVMIFDGEDTTSKGEKIDYFSEVTVPDCVPISTGFYTDSIGFVQTQFFDITAGISDPMIFIPPSNCKAI